MNNKNGQKYRLKRALVQSRIFAMIPDMGTKPRNTTDQQSTDKHLQGLWAGDQLVLERIYQTILPKLAQWIRRNNGSDEAAADIFQSAILIVFEKQNDANFQLTTTFENYLLSVARYLWLRQLRKRKNRPQVTLAEVERYIVEPAIEKAYLKQEKRLLFQEKFAALGRDCQRVLHLFFQGTPLAAIAKQMGYTYDYVKKKNRLCKQKLAKLIHSDSRYHELKE